MLQDFDYLKLIDFIKNSDVSKYRDVFIRKKTVVNQGLVCCVFIYTRNIEAAD